MTLIANCLAKLVRQGKVTQKQADAAQALHDGIQGRLVGSMPQASANAYAALEAARVMAAGAQARKLSIAKQLIASNAAQARVASHPNGKAAGLMSEMTTDIHEAARGANIESLSETIAAKLMAKFKAGAEALRSRAGGLRQDRETAERTVRELFGVDTGDDVAKRAAQGFREASELGVARALAGGKLFTEADDWRLPQFWQSSRVAQAGEAEFSQRILSYIDTGALRVMDKRTGGPAARTDIPNIVKTAFEDIATGAGRGGGAAFNPEMRVFRFADGEAGAKAWLDLQGQFGPGRDIYGLLTGHINAMAREIAFVDTWGPDYRATFRDLVDSARRDERLGKKPAVVLRWIESATAAERTFKVLTGEANEISSEVMAGIFSGLRASLAAAQLGSAIVPSVFGDSVTSALAASYNGIPGVRVVARTIELMAKDSPTLRADLARLNVTAFATIDSALGAARYLDDSFSGSISAALRGKGGGGTAARRFQEIAGGAANFVIRAQGLQAWTEALKRAFTMEMLGYAASQQVNSWDRLDAPFRKFLTRRGITSAEWDSLRDVPPIDIDGARFFDVDGVSDARLGEKLLSAIIDERRYAALEPSARVQQVTTQGLARGTLMGELVRSGAAYKSFPMMMLIMHGSRAWLQSPATRVAYLGSLALMSTMAGAATLQVKSMLQGKDPRRMDEAAFWGAAFIAGGGAGIFGDLLYEGFTRGGGGLVATAVGPLGSLVESAGRLVFPTTRKAFEGEPSAFGAELARFLRWNMPGTNLWYARLALDRTLWDQVQTMVDPDYRQSFRRMEQRAKRTMGQEFWWRPGEVAPSRAPNLGAIAP